MNASLPPLQSPPSHHVSRAAHLLNQITTQQNASFFITMGTSKDEKDDKKAKIRRHQEIQDERKQTIDSPPFHEEVSRSLASQLTKIDHLNRSPRPSSVRG